MRSHSEFVCVGDKNNLTQNKLWFKYSQEIWHNSFKQQRRLSLYAYNISFYSIP